LIDKPVMTKVQKSYLWFLFTSCVLVYSSQLADYFHYSRFLAGSVLVLVVTIYLLTVGGKPLFTLSFPGILLTGFVIISTLSIFWAGEKAEALFSAQKWILLLGFYLIFKTLYQEVPREILWSLLATVSRTFTVLILMVVGYALTDILRTRDFSNESLYGLQVLFGHKSLIAAFLFLLLPLNLLPGFHQSLKWPVLLLTGCQILLILMLQSRTVYLSLLFFLIILGGLLYRYREEWKPLLKPVFTPLILVLAGAAGVFLWKNADLRERLDVTRYLKSQTATERQDVWRLSMPLIRDHWILGVGGGNWKIQFPGYGVEGSYRMQDQSVFFTRAHNDFIEVLAETGLPGLLLYMAIFGYAFLRLYRCRKKVPWQSSMLLAGILGFLVSSLLDFPKERIEFLAMLSVYLGLVAISLAGDTRQFVRWKSFRGVMIALSIVMAFNVYTGIRHYRAERLTVVLMRDRAEGNWENVIELSGRAESCWHHLDPSSVPLSYYRGLAYYQLGQLEEAEGAFQKAHRHSPYNFHVLNNLATVALEKNDVAGSLVWLREALRINPRFEDALFNLSYAYTLQGAYEQALEVLESVPGDTPKKELFREEIRKLLNDKK
jgi:O-antigen ligase